MLTSKLKFLKLVYQTIFHYVLLSSKEKIVESKYTYVYKRVITDDATKRFTETVA